MNYIKHKLYAFTFWRTRIGEVLNKIYDIKIHFKYTFKLNNNQKKEQLKVYLQKQFHVIERGMNLHSKGIGSIALNTDIPYVIERNMKKEADIPVQERLIMYLGIGMLKDKYKVAISKRKNINEILNIHG